MTNFSDCLQEDKDYSSPLQHVRLPSFPLPSHVTANVCESTCTRNKSTHRLIHTQMKYAADLAEGALTQDLAQLELLRVSLLRALFNMMRDADLLHRHVVLKNNKHRAMEKENSN